ncbi:hypothetical protein GQ53DRAFT_769094 [Thozetella sp. PMI_491]|nr:hypothetical protein GQ53DRAFT_769094 [Thozetella sp. PMI_491]
MQQALWQLQLSVQSDQSSWLHGHEEPGPVQSRLKRAAGTSAFEEAGPGAAVTRVATSTLQEMRYDNFGKKRGRFKAELEVLWIYPAFRVIYAAIFILGFLLHG